MCVELEGNAKRIKRVLAWKLFEFVGRSRKLAPIATNHFDFYVIGKLYHAKSFHGFQAFVTKDDADNADANWPRRSTVRQVILYDAAQGVVKGMGADSDDKPGWTARRMKILPKRSSKK